MSIEVLVIVVLMLIIAAGYGAWPDPPVYSRWVLLVLTLLNLALLYVLGVLR